jgi:hypothetical protein
VSSNIIFFGFESGSADEYTGASGLTVDSTHPYHSTYYAHITSGGYVYYTVPAAEVHTNITSCNVRLQAGAIVKPIILTRTDVVYSVSISDNAGGNGLRDIRLDVGGHHTTVAFYIAPDSWANIVLVQGYKIHQVHINGVKVIDDTSLSLKDLHTITEIRAEATSTVLEIDDIAHYAGAYNGCTAVVFGYYPKTSGDRFINLTRNTGSYNSACIDDFVSDDDTTYVFSMPNPDKYDLYSCHLLPTGNIYPRKIKSIIALRTHVTSRCSSGAGSIRTGFLAGIDTDHINWGTAHIVNSNYVVYSDVFPDSYYGLFDVNWFTQAGNYRQVLIGVSHASPAGTVRTTKVRATVLVLMVGAMPENQLKLSGGFDLYFETSPSAWETNDTMTFHFGVKGQPVGVVGVGTGEELALRFKKKTTGVWASLMLYYDSDTCSEDVYVGTTTATMYLRIVMHDRYISLFNGGEWIYTFTIDFVEYPDTLYIHLVTSVDTAINNVLLSELCDWREAVYIDMQTNAGGGISDIIQERPIEINPVCSKIVDFSYYRERDSVTPVNIYRHEVDEAISPNAGSHFIVYGVNTGLVVDEEFMDDSGYLSRFLQLSQLDTGTDLAALLIAQKGREQQESHTVQLAPDIRVEPGDAVNINYTLSGTGTVVSHSLIAEEVSLQIREAVYTMQIKGRKWREMMIQGVDIAKKIKGRLWFNDTANSCLIAVIR